MSPAGSLEPIERLERSGRPHRLRVGETELAWREWGQGPALVLVHGGTGSWLHWVRNIEAFVAAGYRVLAPDLAGFGDSGDAPPGFGAAGQARALLAGIDTLGLEQPVLAGFSFGAIVCGIAAAQSAQPMRALLLVGAVGLGIDRGSPLPMRAWKHLDTGEGIAQAHRHNLHTLMLAHEHTIDRLAMCVQSRNAQHARFYTKRSSSSAALAEALVRVSAPVAGIWGSRDATAQCDPARVRAGLARACPAARLHVIDGAGHWVQFEAPDAFNAAALRLIADPSG